MTDKPTVPGTVELAACPFCGSSDVDPRAWSSNGGEHGPGCMECGATAESPAAWNKRASTSTPAPIPQCEWSLALQSLTPGGSEYVDDPARCVAFVRDTRTSQHETIKRQQRQLNELRGQLGDVLAEQLADIPRSTPAPIDVQKVAEAVCERLMVEGAPFDAWEYETDVRDTLSRVLNERSQQ